MALAVAALFHVRDAGVGAQEPPDGLTFFKNYFVTGDYTAAGVGLRGKGVNGFATDSIWVGDNPATPAIEASVPAGAEAVAAFLYWQVVTTTGSEAGNTGVRFKGFDLSADNPATADIVDPEPFGKVLAFAGSAPCYNPGGSTGGTAAVTWTYRADVLRFFQPDLTGTPDTNDHYGKLQVNGPHEVTLPDSGPNGNNSPMALGASLVIVYRTPSSNLSAVVIYDDGATLGNEYRTLDQQIQGFYQASTTPNARISYLVGSGQLSKNDYLVVPGEADPRHNVFSASDDDSWDTLTYAASVLPNASQVQTVISNDVCGGGGRDCLTPAAIVFKTEVQDTDGDGLVDVWETAGAPEGGTAPLFDPNGQPLPVLGAMGADESVPDVFVQIDYMNNGASTYGGVPEPAHSHVPGPEALRMVGDAFKGSGPTDRIRVHFDIGNWAGTAYESLADTGYLVPSALARGGDAIPESVTQCERDPLTDPEWGCQFGSFPGTVGWKTGYRFLRDEVFGVTPPLPGDLPEDLTADDFCGTLVPAESAAFPGQRYVCERRFDETRHNMFHYSFFAHALGLPKSPDACRAPDPENPGAYITSGPDESGFCPEGTESNPAFHTPRTNTGIADFPGADTLITLGGFDDVSGLPVGTPFMQASTLMHELGHNFERRHGGEVFKPNCKPTYLSVMNYLYQLRGLLDNDGLPHLDFSYGLGAEVNEASLDPNVDHPEYRIGWYAPLEGSYLFGLRGPALSHCNGSSITPGEPAMVRIDAREAGVDIDWDADNVPGFTSPQDVNFSGTADELLADADDWSALRLNLVGIRRNVGAKYEDPATGAILTGAFSVATGKSELGKSELGKSELGKSELGKSELGKSELGTGDLNQGDMGKSELGSGDIGRGDAGGGDLFRADPQAGELDADTAGDLARTPPNRFRACLVNDTSCQSDDPTANTNDVQVTWLAPNVGGVVSYSVYRVEGHDLGVDESTGLPIPWVPVTSVAQVPGQLEYAAVEDNARLVNGTEYTYFVVAEYGDGVSSDLSRLDTITAVDLDPAADDDSFSTDEDTTLTVAAPGVLGNDADPDDPGRSFTAELFPAGQVVPGLTFNADGSFTYTPAANFNTSTTPVTFTYRALTGSFATPTATVSIAVRPVNDAPVGADRTVTVAEDGTYAFGAADFGFADPLDSPANLLSAVRISALPAAGALRYNGAAVVAGQTVAAANLGLLTFAPAANANGLAYASFAFQVQDDGGTERGGVDLDPTPNLITINVTPVADAPTIAPVPLPNVSINWNTSTAPIAFTIGDADGLAGLTLSGASSNPTLVPTANIVFGGSGASRTVTVTPATDQFGTATITVTVSDGSASASTTFQLTVNQVLYTFVPVSNLPPSKTKSGSTSAMKWRYQDGTTVLDTSSLTHTITVCRVVGATCTPVDRMTNTDSGGSSFRYSNNTWTFNLQTKDRFGVNYPVGDYQIEIVPDHPRYQSGGPYSLTITR